MGRSGKRAVKEGSLTKFQPYIESFAEEIFASGTRAQKMDLTKAILPYAYKRMPQAMEHSGPDGDSIPHKIILEYVN